MIFSKILSVCFAAVYCSKLNGWFESARVPPLVDPKRLRVVEGYLAALLDRVLVKLFGLEADENFKSVRLYFADGTL